jgi:3-phosphoshikimate 1-carboxyvinyltransferase
LKAIIKKSELNGKVQAPSSKSYTHRAIVSGLLSNDTTRISNPLYCEDTEASLRISEMMGAQIKKQQDLMVAGPSEILAPKSMMDCGGSGTTLRLFTALAALTNGLCILSGNQSLQARPMTELLLALDQLGVNASSIRGDGKPPVQVIGKGLEGGIVKIRGDISSQYISGLLFACSKAKNESKIEITTKLESRPYVAMTLEVMKKFGVSAEHSKKWDVVSIPGQQNYEASHYEVPGDFSSAAFLLVGGALCGNVTVTGLDQESRQGDSHIVDILEKMGISIELSLNGIAVRQSAPTSLDIDVSDIPDLVPILAVLVSQANGRSRIYNAKRLRFKESDRLATTTSELRKMGARIDITDDGLIIQGPTQLQGAVIDSHNDHRIAMALTIAGLVSSGSTVIQGVECVEKSYPDFLKHIQSLGAEIDTNHKRERRRNIE